MVAMEHAMLEEEGGEKGGGEKGGGGSRVRFLINVENKYRDKI